MIITMIAMPVMQTTRDQIVEMVPMGNPLMAAFTMPAGAGNRRAGVRVRRVDLKAMLVIVIFVQMMQMTVMQIVYVSIVLNLRMTAVGAMNVFVIGVYRVTHCIYSFVGSPGCDLGLFPEKSKMRPARWNRQCGAGNVFLLYSAFD
jgi:hypothetical protein